MFLVIEISHFTLKADFVETGNAINVEVKTVDAARLVNVVIFALVVVVAGADDRDVADGNLAYRYGVERACLDVVNIIIVGILNLLSESVILILGALGQKREE